MYKSTIILAISCVILAAITAVVVWRLVQYPERSPAAMVDGARIDIGLADITSSADEKKFTAASVLLYDADTQRILFEQNAFERRPIASITKLMTAMVALDYGIPWEKEAIILPDEYVQGGTLQLFSGERVTMRDLFSSSLIGSANNATLAYVRELGIPEDEFLEEMNRKAIVLGLEQTEFTDVTGLDVGNISTAYEVAILAHTAFTQYPDISDITSQKEYVFTIRESDREHTIRNTNKLVSEMGERIRGGKTGYLYEALFCLVVHGTGNRSNRITVVLGSPSEAEHFADTKKLLYMDVD